MAQREHVGEPEPAPAGAEDQYSLSAYGELVVSPGIAEVGGTKKRWDISNYGLPFAASRDWIVVLRVCCELCRSRRAWVLCRMLLARQIESLPVYVYAGVFSHHRRRVAMVRDEQDENNIFFSSFELRTAGHILISAVRE